MLAFNLTLTLTGNAEVVCAAKLTTVARGKVCKENETNDWNGREGRRSIEVRRQRERNASLP